MESEFFGHKKGSFTGAHADKPGLFQTADGGTLFLDEVAELPLSIQVKLLRAIQEKKIRPVGASAEIDVDVDVDVRILSATHKDLNALVNAGSFRHDLYYRINVIELHVPALRERDGDLPLLSDAMFARLAQAMHRPAPRLDPQALEALVSYGFPGNVRELENILERAMAMADGDTITAADLRLPGGSTINAPGRGIPLPGGDGPTPSPGGMNPRDTASSGLPSYIEEIQRAAIQQALQENRYNKTKAAAAQGSTFRALRYKSRSSGSTEPGRSFPCGIDGSFPVGAATAAIALRPPSQPRQKDDAKRHANAPKLT